MPDDVEEVVVPGLWNETFGQVGAFLKVLEDAGFGLASLKKLLAFPDFVKRLYRFNRDGCVSPASLEVAREIMKNNMVEINEVRRVFPSKYIAMSGWFDLMKAFVPFDQGLLETCKHTHLLIPGLPVTFEEMASVAEEAHRSFFYVYREPGLTQRDRPAHFQTMPMGWMLVRKMPISHSPGCNYPKLEARYLGPDDYAPTLESLVYVAMVALETRRIGILSKANMAPVFTPTVGQEANFGAGFLNGGVIEISRFCQKKGTKVLLTSAKRPLFVLER